MNTLKNIIIQIGLLFLGCFFIVNSAFAVTNSTTEVYKWTDKDGNVHYAARPGDASAIKMNKLRKRFSTIEYKDTYSKAENKNREKMCLDAKSTKKKYQSAPFVFREDKETKKQIRLTEQESKDALLRVDKDISYWCSPPPTSSTSMSQ